MKKPNNLMLAGSLGDGDTELLLEAFAAKGGHVAEVKYDGFRCVVTASSQGIRLEGRYGGDYTDRFPEVVKDLSDALRGRHCVLDGEVGAFRGGNDYVMDITSVQSRARVDAFRIRMHAKMDPLVFVAFDVLEDGGEDLRGKPYDARRKALESIGVRKSKQDADLLGLFREVQELGGEGIIVKERQSPYTPGRGTAWLKAKSRHYVDDLLVVGLTKGSGKREESFGSLILAKETDEGLVYVCKAGSGLSDAELNSIMAQRAAGPCPWDKSPVANSEVQEWLEPTIVASVKYEPKTRVSPRHPRVVKVAERFPPAEMTNQGGDK